MVRCCLTAHHFSIQLAFNENTFNMPDLSSSGFDRLLSKLDADSTLAAEKYEVLRVKLVSCLTWRGCPESQADALADETLDRVALKLENDTDIENINAYACQVMRFVWLEHRRKHKEDQYGDDAPEQEVQPETPEDVDLRMICLRECLAKIAPESSDERKLILDYYDAPDDSKTKDWRKTLAGKFGLSANSLKVRACRLREKLEKCINDCVGKKQKK